MTITATSASSRSQALRAALEIYDQVHARPERNDLDMVAAANVIQAARNLIDAPDTFAAAHEAADRIFTQCHSLGIEAHENEAKAMIEEGYQAGVQAAWESWEPADVPCQEFMLRALGIDCHDSTDDEGNPSIFIRAQHIDKED